MRRTAETRHRAQTAAALALGFLALLGSALFGIANLQTVFQVRAARPPAAADASAASTP